jgi:hypothetical protein
MRQLPYNLAVKGIIVSLPWLLLLAGCAGAKAAPLRLPFAGLPELPPYDDLALAARGTSMCDPPGVAQAGIHYYYRGGSTIELASGWLELAGGGAEDFGWALYRLPNAGLVSETLTVEMSPLGSPGDKELWYAYPDYGTGRWHWAPPTENGTFALPLQPNSTTALGATYLALAKLGSKAEVHKVSRTGQPSWQQPSDAQALTVGPGKTYATLEDAYDAAPALGGATILVYAQAGNAPYVSPALQVYKPDIVLWGVGAPSGERVKLDGGSFNYTGAGSVPRAVFQFNPGADGGCVRGFDIYEAHNDSYNGAAVRINQANHVRVFDCEIHDCDMGIMSNGDASANPQTAADQWIENCLIHDCGQPLDPGYNHNLYLGGTSVTLRGCQVWGSLTGHNVKSRAHYNRIEYCHIHDSANRELDLVDEAGNTTLPGSDTLILGCIIVKDPLCAGNRNVIHCGSDGGNDHYGTLHLVNNTIVTPFISPVVLLSAPNTWVNFINNIVWDQASGQQDQTLVDATGGGSTGNVQGSHNWFSLTFSPVNSGLDVLTSWYGGPGEGPPFTNAAMQDYRLSGTMQNITDSGEYWGSLTPILERVTPGHTHDPWEYYAYQFQGPACLTPRIVIDIFDLGAFEYAP